ncbi:hypothetical protein D3C81_984860 [compost metagenome]
MRHAFHCLAHALHGGLENVEAVDLCHVDHDDAVGQRPLDDAVVQQLALGGRERLGVVQAVEARTVRAEHYGGNRHRAGQRTTPRFIDTCMEQRAGNGDGRRREQRGLFDQQLARRRAGALHGAEPASRELGAGIGECRINESCLIAGFPMDSANVTRQSSSIPRSPIPVPRFSQAAPQRHRRRVPKHPAAAADAGARNRPAGR